MAAGRKQAPAVKTPKAKPAAKRKAPAKRTTAKAESPAPTASNGPAYWLFKSEPDVFSWDDLKGLGKKGQEWDGVRNYLARNNMRAMKLGDLGFFYHSNAGKDIVGICEVCALAHPDSTTNDDRWECVDIRAVCDMPQPVTLADVKASPDLAKMSLVTSMRLSVQPVTPEEWAIVCDMGGLDADKLRR